MSDQPEEPKIIVDEDWKAKAQAEKEQLEQSQQEKRSSDDSTETGELPPADFRMLVSTVATQAMAALGRVPDAEGKLFKQLEVAKFHIDMLGVLEEKTKGNLTAEEQAMMTQVLHELRMDFVAGGYHPPVEEKKDESDDFKSKIQI